MYGVRYWWTPNIPTIKKAIWMKLAIMGAHINPRKSNTCRSSTKSCKENNIARHSVSNNLPVGQILSTQLQSSYSKARVPCHRTIATVHKFHTEYKTQYRTTLTNWRTKRMRRTFLPRQKPMFVKFCAMTWFKTKHNSKTYQHNKSAFFVGLLSFDDRRQIWKCAKCEALGNSS